MPLARVYLVVGLAAIGLYFLLPWDTLGQSLLYDLIGASSAVAVVAGARKHRPSLAVAWYLFAAGLMAFAVGDVIFNLYASVWHRDPPIPSVADVWFVIAYPLLIGGVIAFIVAYARSGFPMDGTAVAFIVLGLGAVAVAWPLLRPIVHSSDAPLPKALNVAYPALDLILLVADQPPQPADGALGPRHRPQRQHRSTSRFDQA